MEPGAQHGRREGRQFGLDRGAEGVGEPPRGLHHHVDQIPPTVQSQLGSLLVQIGDGLVHLGDGVLAHAGPLVQDPVHGGLAEPGLLGDLADLVSMRHRAFAPCNEVFLMDSCR